VEYIEERFSDVAAILAPEFENDYEYDVIAVAGVERLPQLGNPLAFAGMPFAIIERRLDGLRMAVGLGSNLLKDPNGYADRMRLQLAQMFTELDQMQKDGTA
jgi:hypothetical protein